MKTAEQLIQQAKKQIKEVTVHELYEVMKNNQVILIDVREPDEFHEFAIKHAINYPRGVLEMRIQHHPTITSSSDIILTLQQLKDRTIYLICETSGRSALAANSLQQMGFTQVFSIEGGYQAWKEQGYPMM